MTSRGVTGWPSCQRALRPQAVGDGTVIFRVARALGDQAIFRRHFVERRRHQRVVDQLDAGGERPLHPGDDEIEIVEGADSALAHHAALRGVRIDVVEMLEVGRVFEVAEQRQAVPENVLRATLMRCGGDRLAGPIERCKRRRCGRQSSAADQIASGEGQGASPKSRTVGTDYVRFWMCLDRGPLASPSRSISRARKRRAKARRLAFVPTPSVTCNACYCAGCRRWPRESPALRRRRPVCRSPSAASRCRAAVLPPPLAERRRPVCRSLTRRRGSFRCAGGSRLVIPRRRRGFAAPGRSACHPPREPRQRPVCLSLTLPRWSSAAARGCRKAS